MSLDRRMTAGRKGPFIKDGMEGYGMWVKGEGEVRWKEPLGRRGERKGRPGADLSPEASVFSTMTNRSLHEIQSAFTAVAFLKCLMRRCAHLIAFIR